MNSFDDPKKSGDHVRSAIKQYLYEHPNATRISILELALSIQVPESQIKTELLTLINNHEVLGILQHNEIVRTTPRRSKWAANYDAPRTSTLQYVLQWIQTPKRLAFFFGVPVLGTLFLTSGLIYPPYRLGFISVGEFLLYMLILFLSFVFAQFVAYYWYWMMKESRIFED